MLRMVVGKKVVRQLYASRDGALSAVADWVDHFKLTYPVRVKLRPFDRPDADPEVVVVGDSHAPLSR